jgi:hypothetical protein
MDLAYSVKVHCDTGNEVVRCHKGRLRALQQPAHSGCAKYHVADAGNYVGG